MSALLGMIIVGGCLFAVCGKTIVISKLYALSFSGWLARVDMAVGRGVGQGAIYPQYFFNQKNLKFKNNDI